jgi:hypothetical protein
MKFEHFTFSEESLIEANRRLIFLVETVVSSCFFLELLHFTAFYQYAVPAVQSDLTLLGTSLYSILGIAYSSFRHQARCMALAILASVLLVFPSWL